MAAVLTITYHYRDHTGAEQEYSPPSYTDPDYPDGNFEWVDEEGGRKIPSWVTGHINGTCSPTDGVVYPNAAVIYWSWDVQEL